MTTTQISNNSIQAGLELSSLQAPKRAGILTTAALFCASVSSLAAQEKGSSLTLQQEFVPRRHANLDFANIPGYEMLRTGGVLDLLKGGSRVQENPELSNTRVPKKPLIITGHNISRLLKNNHIIRQARREEGAAIK